MLQTSPPAPHFPLFVFLHLWKQAKNFFEKDHDQSTRRLYTVESTDIIAHFFYHAKKISTKSGFPDWIAARYSHASYSFEWPYGNIYRTEKGNRVSTDFSVQELMIVFDLWCYQVDHVLWQVYVYSIPIITKYFCCRKDLSLNLLKKNTQLKCTPSHHCSHDLVHLLN